MFSSKAQSDTNVIKNVLSGQRNDFAILVERYLPTVQALAYAHLRNHADAEDMTQEAFLQAFRSLNTLREPKRFAGWLATITRNCCNKLWTKRNRENAALSEIPEPQSKAGPDISRKELRELLQYRISQLKTNESEVLMLHYFAGKSVREMAGVLDISRAAAKKRLERARHALGKDLMDHVGTELAPEGPKAEQVKKIMAAIIAAKVAWLAEGAAVGAAHSIPYLLGAALSGVSGKAAVGIAALGLALLCIGAWQHYRPDSHPSLAQLETAVPEETSPSPTEQASVEAPLQDAIEQQVVEETQGSVEPAEAALKQAPKKTISDYRKRITKQLKKPVTITFEDIHITEIIGFISEWTKVDFVLDSAIHETRKKRPAADGEPTETSSANDTGQSEQESYVTDGMIERFDVTDIPLADALAHLLYPRGLDYVLEPGFVWISTPDNTQKGIVREPDERYDAYNLDWILEQPITLTFDNIHICEILGFTSEWTKLNIVLDYRVVEPEHEDDSAEPGSTQQMTVPYINLTKIELRDVLKALLRPLELSYSVENGFIWICPKDRMEAGLFEDREPYSPLLDEHKLDITFEAIQLSTILAHMSESSSTEILLDKQLLRSKDKRLSVPYVEMKDTTLRTGLNALLRPRDLDYAVKDNAIWVSTKDRIANGELDRRKFMAVEKQEVESPDKTRTARTAGTTGKAFGERDLVLLHIVRMPDNRPAARIRLGSSGKQRLYFEGNSFGEYEVLEIDVDKATCSLRNDKTGETLLLRHQ